MSQRPEGASGIGDWKSVKLDPPEHSHLDTQAVNLDHELPNQPSTDVPESVSNRLSFWDKVIVCIIVVFFILIIINAHVHIALSHPLHMKPACRFFTSTPVGRQVSQKQPLSKIPGDPTKFPFSWDPRNTYLAPPRFYFYCQGVYNMNAMYNLKKLGESDLSIQLLVTGSHSDHSTKVQSSYSLIGGTLTCWWFDFACTHKEVCVKMYQQ